MGGPLTTSAQQLWEIDIAHCQAGVGMWEGLVSLCAILAQRLPSQPSYPTLPPYAQDISKSGPKATKCKLHIPFLLQESPVKVPFSAREKVKECGGGAMETD